MGDHARKYHVNYIIHIITIVNNVSPMVIFILEKRRLADDGNNSYSLLSG